MSETTAPVLIQPAVDQFRDLILQEGEHSVVAGDEVYIQPYVYLSAHLVQMRAHLEERLETCYRSLLEEKQAELQGDISGGGEKEEPAWVVQADAEVMQGEEVVATIPAGTTVEVLQKAESASQGEMALISWDSGQGPPVVGWIKADNVAESE